MTAVMTAIAHTGSRWPRVAHGLIVASALLLAAYAAHAQFDLGGAGLDDLFQKWINDLIVLLCSGACLLRAVSIRRDRVAWMLLSAGMASWVIGNIYYSLFLIDLNPLPIPSVGDAFWLGIDPFTYLGLALLVRSRLPSWRTSMWLDAVIAAGAVSSVCVGLVVSAVAGSAVGSPMAALVTDLAYPIGDLVLLGLVVGAIALEGWTADRTWIALAAGFLSFTVTDGLFLVKTADGTYQVGTMIDAGWLLAAVLVAVAAWQPQERNARTRVDGWRFVVMPCAFFTIALAMMTVGADNRARTLTMLLGAATMLGVLARMALTFREYMKMLHERTAEAETDALTGLGNRRLLLQDLQAAADAATAAAPRALGLFDLDGFKPYNDTFGHPAGDALLRRLGGSLDAAVAPAGRAYRIGGDEFCVIVACAPGSAEEVIAGAALALASSGDGFTTRASYGAVELDGEEREASSALLLADQRMYRYKRGGRPPESDEVIACLLRATAERDARAVHHELGVAGMAAGVATALGLAPGEIVEIRRAAELHDIGKIAIPVAIRLKRSELTADDWEVVRSHPLIGERILQAAPSLVRVGRLVRSSHECYDGSGYPDRLAGDAIPLGARIIAVCDAFDAMCADRSFRPALSEPAAEAELARCAGSQFDPAVVEAFVWARRLAKTEATVA